MASETKRTQVQLNNDWQDLCAIFEDIADVDVTIQAKKSYRSQIIFGGDTPPGPDDGALELTEGQSVRGSASHIWAKGGGFLVVHVEG
jgi:hypothetical protein